MSEAERLTPERPLTLNVSAAEREALWSALCYAIDHYELQEDDETAELIQSLLPKVIQEGAQ